jgi:hypothetical protein
MEIKLYSAGNMGKAGDEKKTVTVFLSKREYDDLAAVIQGRAQSRADFLRDAIAAHECIPQVHRRKLTGVCLNLHKARLRREKREGK